MSDWTIGIIGGSGLYAIDALEDAQWIPIQSPWGQPSDEVLCGTIGHVRVRFLPRHGRGHRIAPSTINARANIDALKRAGCTDILAISAVGSLSEELAPGRFVTVDQFIDNTKGRPSTFFGDPVCPRLAKHAAKAVTGAGGECTEGATYLAMEGPQFSTRAESRLYRHWGAEVIGMTGMPEARLAREAELPYALLAMVTDYDCWREEGEAVDLAQVVEQMEQNSKLARKAVEAFCKGLPRKRSPSPIDHALNDAVITATEQHDRATLAKLDAIAGRLLQQG